MSKNIASNLHFRSVNGDETDCFFNVLCAAFQMDPAAARPIFDRDPFYDLKLKRAAFLSSPTPSHGETDSDPLAPNNGGNGEIVSCLTIIPTHLRIGKAIVPMGGIAGVATPPSRRRQGYAGALLSETVRTMGPELGFSLSGLFPAYPDYYARFGWTYATDLCRTVIPAALSPSAGGLSFVRPIDLSSERDLEDVAAVYASQTAARTGACVRGDARRRVTHFMIPGRREIVYDDGEISGYAHYELAGDNGRATLHEMHFRSDTVRDSLLRYIGASPGCREIEWIASEADLDHYAVKGVPISREPDAMLRINDLPGALRAAHRNYIDVLAEANATLAIAAVDAVNPANEQPVAMSAGGIETDSANPALHQIKADIGTLTQLYVGYITPKAAMDEGRLIASSADALELAEQLFPSRAPFISSLDHF